MNKSHDIISKEFSQNLPQDKELWNQIIYATGKMESDVVNSIRIPLYTSLNQADKGTERHGIRDIVKAAYSVNRALFSYKTSYFKNINGKVLFSFPYSTASNINNLLPVARLAKDKGLLGGLIVGDNVKPLLDEFTEYPILTKHDLHGLIGIKEKIKSVYRTYEIYNGVLAVFRSYAPAYVAQLQSIYGNILQQIYTSLLMSVSFRQLFQHWSPSCVVSTSDFWPFEYQLNCQATVNGIPTLVIQHGILNHFWWPFVSNQYCLWGHMFFEEMRHIGAPINRLLVCGMPSTDILFRKYAVETFTKHSIKSCLILSHTNTRASYPTLYNEYLLFLKDLISLSPDIKWKIKLHPSEYGDFYNMLMCSNNNNLEILPKSVSLEQAVRDTDLACTIWSTAGLEAMIMNKPLVVFDIIPEVREIAWWPSYGGGVYAKTPADFMNILMNLRDDSTFLKKMIRDQRDFLNKCFANKGRAAEAIVELLEKYCISYAT